MTGTATSTSTCHTPLCERPIEWIEPEDGDEHGFWRHTTAGLGSHSYLFCWPGKGIDSPRAAPVSGAEHIPPPAVALAIAAAFGVDQAAAVGVDQAAAVARSLSELADSAAMRADAARGYGEMMSAYTEAAKAHKAAASAWSLVAVLAELNNRKG